jgi:ubiquinone biosynthesis monooxygenase Coq6
MSLKYLPNRILFQNNKLFNINLFSSIFRQQYHKINLRKRYLATVSSSTSSDILENIYDIVIVGGGISGSALACALASSSKITGSQKRVAIIESSDTSNIKGWKPIKGEFSNRVSSLTPRSVEFFKGIFNLIYYLLFTFYFIFISIFIFPLKINPINISNIRYRSLAKY